MKTNNTLGGLKLVALVALLTVGQISTVLAASLAVVQSPMPATVDLTAEGSIDWVSWACDAAGNEVQTTNTSPYAGKNSGTAIGAVIYDGTLDAGGTIPLRYLSPGSAGISWSGGDPALVSVIDGVAHPVVTNNSGFLQALTDSPGGQGTSFTFPVTATTTGLNRLTLYVGNFRAKSRLTVTLPGATTVTIPFDLPSGSQNVRFQIDFQADNPGDVVTVKWADEGSNGTFSNIQIIAATLTTGPAPPVVTFDASALPLASGTVVTSWGGQTAGGTPTYLAGQTPNGQPAVEFNGGGDRMGDNVSLPASAAADWILVAVIKPQNIGAYHNLAEDDLTVRPMLWVDSSFNYELNFGGGTGAKAAGQGPDGWDIVIADSRLNQLYVNSPTPNGSGGGAVSYPATKLYDYFQRDGGQTFQGLVAEMRVYNNRADFGGDFAALYQELRGKWIDRYVNASRGATMNFDGANRNYSRIAGFGNRMPTNEITVEFWQRARYLRNQATLYLDPDVPGNRFNAHVPWGDGTVFWDFGNISGAGRLSYVPPVSIVGTWQHFAMVSSFSGQYMRIYRNGVLEASKSSASQFTRGNRDLILGGWDFAGDLDELRIWNVARTTSQIQSNLNTRLTGTESDLVAYYPMSEGAGPVTADASGQNNTGIVADTPSWNITEDAVTPVAFTATATLVTNTGVQLNGLVNTYGATTTNRFEWGAASTALDFSGASQYISAAPTNVPIGNSTYTIEAWIKPDVMNLGGIVGWGVAANNQANSFILDPTGLRHYWWFGDLVAPVGSLVGAWHHVAATFDGVTRRILLDGNVVASDTPSGHNVPNALNFTIGVAPGSQYFDGQMDEVRIWNVARTPNQIQANLNTRLAGNEPGLVAYYPMDEGSGPVTADASGHGNTGTLVNYPAWSPGARPVLDQATSWQPVAGSNSVLNLDGVDDDVTVPSGVWFSNEFTIESWIFERSYNDWARFIDFGNGAGGESVLFGLSFGTSGQPFFQTYPVQQFVQAPNPIPLNEWVHLAVTFKTNTATMYVNGVPVVSGTVAAPNAVNRVNNYIGRSNWGNPGANALFDDVRIWNVARTPDQLRQFSTQPVSPSDPNLVLNYRFDETSGTTAVDSRSTSPQNGTLTNGAGRLVSIPATTPLANLVPGTVYHYRSAAQSSRGLVVGNTERFVTPAPVGGTDLKFDGTSQYVMAVQKNVPIGNSTYTIEAWIKPDVMNYGGIIGWGLNAGNQANSLILDPNGLRHYWWGDDLVAPVGSLVGTWHHVAATFDGVTRRIFLDGNVVASDPRSGHNVPNALNFTIGSAPGSQLFKGQIDEVRIWNVARTTTQIQADTMGSLVGNEPGLVAYYRMDEGAGGTLRDATTNANHGLLVNGPQWLPSTVPPCGVATYSTNGNTVYYQGYQPFVSRVATAPLTNMVVTNLCANILPAFGSPGVQLTDGNASLNLTLNYSGGVWTNVTAGENAASLRVISAGANGYTVDDADATPGANAGSSTINSTGGIITSGNSSAGIQAISQGGAGGWGEGSIIYNGEHGGNGGNGGSTTVSSSSSITTLGASSPGIHAISQGGAGGKGGDSDFASGAYAGWGGSGGSVTINGNGMITTTGNSSIGVLAVSQAGQGGNGGSGDSFGSGGSGGAGGSGGTATVDGSWTIRTAGENASGISARSLGGAGGQVGNGTWASVVSPGGGGNSGHGAQVTVQLAPGGDIQTIGQSAYGIYAQSIGGFAGGGGQSSFLFSGGSAGSAGNGGSVLVTNRGVITTSGEGAHAVFAESVGGGGGSGGGGGGLFDGGGNDSSAGGKGGLVTVNNQGQLITSNNFARGIFAQSVGGSGGEGATDSGLFYSVGGAGGKGGDGSLVTVTNGGQIVTAGSDSSGIFAQSVGGGGGTGGGAASVGAFASVSIGGSGGDGGDGSSVHVDSGSLGTIAAAGDRSHGIFAQSVGGGGGNGGFAVAASVGTEVSLAIGVGGGGGLGGSGSNVVVMSQSSITTAGQDAHGIVAQSVGGGGGSGGFSIAVSAAKGLSGAISVGGGGGGGGDGQEVFLTSTGDIGTLQDRSYGLFAQSVGGGGGDGGFSIAGAIGAAGLTLSLGGTGGGGGTGANVGVTNSGSILTGGELAYGIMAQSVGGGGGSGGFSIAASLALSPEGGGLAFSLGGAGGIGVEAGRVDVSNSGTIVTENNTAHAIFAQSLGGGGGAGGFAGSFAGGLGTNANLAVSIGGRGGDGGSASNVFVQNLGTIATHGNDAKGVYAQSVGGGGGDGGFGLSATLNAGAVGLSFAVGGNGGSGGKGGAADVVNSGVIDTFGVGSHGIHAQSIGGGGGNGGFSAAGSLTTSTNATQVSVSLGGYGGSGNVAGAVNVLNEVGASITTFGDKSVGILAESIGGGGGNGGLSFAGNLAITKSNSVSRNVSVALGGGGGSGNKAGAVGVTNGGAISTYGEAAHGIWATSIGGGGGNGGSSIAGNRAAGMNLVLSMGGNGGSGGIGSNVTVVNTGSIITRGSEAHGIYAQSVGGGGGNGATQLKIDDYYSTELGGGVNSGSGTSIAVMLGGTGGTGNTGGLVTVTNSGSIETTNSGSHGIFALSVGGGGGKGGNSSSSSGSATNLSLSLSMGGNGGTNSGGGNVVVANTGSIITRGDDAHGIVAQSVGGGGGEGGTSSSSASRGSTGTNNAFAFSLALGGKGGQGNTGGSVSVNNAGTIETFGDRARGVFAQSVGAGGGSGGGASATQIKVATNLNNALQSIFGLGIGGSGGSGGMGGSVGVTNTGQITTHGEDAYGIFAQSVGGGGGIGGSTSTKLGVDGDPSGLAKLDLGINLTLGIGGSGGSGNHGGTARVNNSGIITTYGDGAHAILAQSIGAGGGIGGNRETSTNSFSLKTYGLGLGGSSGSAGDGGLVAVNSSGAITTAGLEAYGIFAQSIGGGGGLGGSGRTADTEAQTRQISLALGGNGGTAGNGGTVTVTNDGTINTIGDGSHAIIAQSVGGGGGIGGKGAAGLLSSIILGGGDDTAGDGGDVTVVQSGDITTLGDDANGITAQSIGGGGGMAGNVNGGIIDRGINALFGQSGASSGNGGGVTVSSVSNITTFGSSSYGIFAQSVGGGGGVSGGLLGGLGFAGSSGGSGNGGAVKVTHSGNIQTYGTAADGIFAQSVGGSNGIGGPVNITVTGDITAHGTNSSGIYAQSTGGSGGGNISINVLAGSTVFGGSGNSAGVRIEGGANNTLTNHGTITTLNGATGVAIEGGNSNESVQNYGTLVGQVLLGGGVNSWVNHPGSSFTVETTLALGAGNLFANQGLVKGSGTITGNVSSTGVIAPGNSAGALTINGDLHLLGSSMMTFEIGGLIATNDYDVLNVTNFLEFAGTLSLELINNFLPASTDTFTLVSFGSSSSTFGNVSGGRISLTNNLASFAVTQSATNFVIGGVEYIDTDGDGQGDLQEQAAGTDANDSASAMQITSITQNSSNHLVVTFQSVTNKTYRIEYSSNLVAWPIATTNVPSAGTSTVWTDDGSLTGGLPTAPRYYRVGLQ